MVSLRIFTVACALVAAPVLLHAQREKLPPDDLDAVEKLWPNAQKSNTGIRYVVEMPGDGPLISSGDVVKVNYTGRFLNGKIFDQDRDRIHPFIFRVNRGNVIEGWDQIFQLMSPGAKWLVIVPPELAYGRKGSPPRIPSYATLVFEIEVLGVKREN
jgi:FKBP-type peptidyl-prolyl cis-trans isomerase